jgi:L-amino acid N-acyltransferase YncA
MPRKFAIRSAAQADAPALLSIYRPFVESTAVSFEFGMWHDVAWFQRVLRDSPLSE